MRKNGVLASGLQVNSDFQQLINDCFVFIQYMWLEHIQDIIYIYIYMYIVIWYISERVREAGLMMSDETKKLILENPRRNLIKEYENVSALFPGLKLTETDAILSALPSSVYSTDKKDAMLLSRKKTWHSWVWRTKEESLQSRFNVGCHGKPTWLLSCLCEAFLADTNSPNTDLEHDSGSWCFRTRKVG